MTLHNTELVVIGDSHAGFWTGTECEFGSDSIPSVRAQTISGALAFNLTEEVSTTDSRNRTFSAIHQAINAGFKGWFLLAFGAMDCDCTIWRYAPVIGLEQAVRDVVDRYVLFIQEVRALHPNVAIWAPAAARYALPNEVITGTEAERNLAILIFTAMLQEAFADTGVPVISIAESLIDEHGRTRKNIFRDNNHLSQAHMYQALEEVNRALGLSLRIGSPAVPFLAKRVEKFAQVDCVTTAEGEWLRLMLPDSAQFITEIEMYSDVYQLAGEMNIGLALDTSQYTGYRFLQSGPVVGGKSREAFPLNRSAKTIILRAYGIKLEAEMFNVFIKVSPFSLHAQEWASKASMLAARDQIMKDARTTRESTVNVITSETTGSSDSTGSMYSALKLF